MRPNNIIKNWLKYTCIAAYLALFLWLLMVNIHLFDHLSLPFFTLLLITTIFSFLANGMINYCLFQSVIEELSISNGLKLAIISNIGNYLPLSAGLIGKGIYLNKYHSLNYGEYAYLSVSMMLIHTSLSGIIGLIAIFHLGIINYELLLVFILLTSSIMFLIIAAYPFMGFSKQHLLAGINKSKTVIYNKILSLIFGQMIYIFTQMLVLYLSFAMIGKILTFWEILLYAAGLTITRFVNILPGSIGTREAILIVLGLYTGMAASIAILGIGIARITAIAVVFPWGLILYKNHLTQEKVQSHFLGKTP